MARDSGHVRDTAPQDSFNTNMSGVSLNQKPGHHRGRLRLRLATGDVIHCRHGCCWLVGRMLLCWGTPAQAEAVTTRIVHVWVPAGSEIVGREPVSTLVTLDVVHGSARNNGNALTAGVLAATVAHTRQHHMPYLCGFRCLPGPVLPTASPQSGFASCKIHTLLNPEA